MTHSRKKRAFKKHLKKCITRLMGKKVRIILRKPEGPFWYYCVYGKKMQPIVTMGTAIVLNARMNRAFTKRMTGPPMRPTLLDWSFAPAHKAPGLASGAL